MRPNLRPGSSCDSSPPASVLGIAGRRLSLRHVRYGCSIPWDAGGWPCRDTTSGRRPCCDSGGAGFRLQGSQEGVPPTTERPDGLIPAMPPAPAQPADPRARLPIPNSGDRGTASFRRCAHRSAPLRIESEPTWAVATRVGLGVVRLLMAGVPHLLFGSGRASGLRFVPHPEDVVTAAAGG